MATIISQPASFTGAYGENKIKINTLNPSVNQLRYELEKNDVILGEQFIPIYPIFVSGIITFLQSDIDVHGLYSSALPSFNNIMETGTVFTEIDAINHQALVKDIITEDISGGAVLNINRHIFKSIDVKYGTEWDATKNFNPLHKNKDGKIIRKVFNKQKIPVNYYTFNTGTTYIIGLGMSSLGNTSLSNHYRLATFTLNTSSKTATIEMPLADNIDLVIDGNDYMNKKVIYFLNRWGGWEWFCATHYETREITEKGQYTKYASVDADIDVLQIIDSTIVEQRLYGDLMNSDAYEYLKDLINSPIVLDEQGNRIRLLDNTIKYGFRDLIDPQFTIQYVKRKNINY